jgi:hypothetical protein
VLLQWTASQAPDPPPPGTAPAGHVDHHAPGEAAGQVAQHRIGGAGEVGEQRHRLVLVGGQGVVEGPLVEVADLGRHLLELLVP